MSSRQHIGSEKRHGAQREAGYAPHSLSAAARPAWHGEVSRLQRLLGNSAFGAGLRAAAGVPHLAPIVPSSVPDVLGGDAQPLDPDLRALLSASGQEVSDVRVHTDAAAVESARAMDAAGYTWGTHIVLDETQARPGTERRRQLLNHELAHVAHQRASGPALQLAVKTDRLREAIGRPVELDPSGVLPDPGLGQPGEARALGSEGEGLDVEWLREKLHQADYDEVYAKGEFAQSRDGWLERAFPDERSRPDMVAIRNQEGAKQVLVLDVTSEAGSVADIKPGDKRSLPVEWETRTSPGFQGNQYRSRDLADEMQPSRTQEVPVQPYESVKQPHIAKTIDNARQVARNLPENLEVFSVVAREYHWRTGELTKENIVKGRLERPTPVPSGSIRGTRKGTVVPRTEAATSPGSTAAEQAGPSGTPAREPTAIEREPTTARRAGPEAAAQVPTVPVTAPESGRGIGSVGAPQAEGVTGSHESLEPFRNLPRSTPTAVGGPAVEAGAQLLVEIEEALERESMVRDSLRAGSLRTYRWWLQRGIQPPAKAIYDRWFVRDESDTDPEAIGRRIRSGRLSGMEVGRITSAEQYRQLEAWVHENIHTWDDFYQHFISSEDAGVRWHDGRFEVVTWEWGDWWPANVTQVIGPDEHIEQFMNQVLTDVVARTAQEVAALPSTQGAFAAGSAARIVGVRTFRRWGDKSPVLPATQIPLPVSWDPPPVFYEIAGVEGIPSGYTLVTGADFATYQQIYGFRAYYDRGSRPATISGPARYDLDRPYTGWGPVNAPCILVLTDALASTTNP